MSENAMKGLMKIADVRKGKGVRPALEQLLELFISDADFDMVQQNSDTE
ncbi:MAG: hypothetical protein P4M11_14845 [Candidatus Pacebacteria bacterium]|nr:hypothetical protein [Candidatus Paceibacterota bacterium]